MTRNACRKAGGLAAALLLAGMATAGLADGNDAPVTPGAMEGMDHSGHGAMAAPQSAASMAYAEANDRMHAGMAITFTDDADVDFALGMIPHHQGAIDMAKVVLEYGQDPELRALAEEIIAAQEGEIAFLREWLAKRGH